MSEKGLMGVDNRLSRLVAQEISWQDDVKTKKLLTSYMVSAILNLDATCFGVREINSIQRR